MQNGSWQQDLIAKGYSRSFPCPTWLIQTILTAINLDSFHQAIIHHDTTAVSNDTPSMLATASINDWLFFLKKVNQDPNMGMEKLKLFLSLLQTLENFDGESLKQAKILVDKVLPKLASFLNYEPTLSINNNFNMTNSLLCGNFLSEDDKTKILGFTSLVIKSDDKTNHNKNPIAKSDPFLIIPLLPPRQIEADSVDLHHKLWNTNTMNYPSPFTLESLLLLFNFDNVELEVCKAFAVKGKHLLAKDLGFDFGFFSLKTADPSKCENPIVSFRAKAPNPHEYKEDNYLRNIWNLYRPYVKCRCWANKNTSCKAGIMWVDHLLWFMLHNCPSFFLLSSNIASLFACISWMNALPHELKQAIIIYYIIHTNMLEKAKLLCDSELPTPPILDNTPLNTLILSLFNPDKNSFVTPQVTKKARFNNSSGNANLSNSTSASRKYRGSKMKQSDLSEVQRLINWPS